jgi:hypothetical protein
MSQTFAAVARHRRSRPSAESRRTEKPGSADLETAAPRRCRRDRRARQPPRAGTQPTPEPRPRSVGLPTSRPPAGAANAPRAAGQDSRPWRLPSIGSSERTCLDDGVALVWAHCRGQPSRAAPASLSLRRFSRCRPRPRVFARFRFGVAHPSWWRSPLAYRPQLAASRWIELAAATRVASGLWVSALALGRRPEAGGKDRGTMDWRDIEQRRVRASRSRGAANDRREVDKFVAALGDCDGEDGERPQAKAAAAVAKPG